MDPRQQQRDSPLSWLIRILVMVPVVAIVAVVLVVSLPFMAVYSGLHTVRGMNLDRAYRRKFASRGKFAILIYSESPHWQDYFEERILPGISDHAVVLNWSERREWRTNRTLPIKVYEHHRPYREFNPYALVYGPQGSPTRIPFFAAFRDNKHGKPAALTQAVADLSAAVERASADWREAVEARIGAA